MQRHFFKNRAEAGGHLAQSLVGYRGKDALVLGLPRGGIPVAAEVAAGLDAELDVVLARKLRSQHFPEIAIGAVWETGLVEMNADARFLDNDPDYVEEEVTHLRTILQDLRRRYAAHRFPALVKDRLVIVVDDGVASGCTMRAALRSLRAQGAARLVMAVPVAYQQPWNGLKPLADDSAVLVLDDSQEPLRDYYQDFPAVPDEEVKHCLTRLRKLTF